MDPLSIAAVAIALSSACFQAGTAIHKYVEEVREVDETVALLGQYMNTISKSLLNVHDVLKKNGPSLKAAVGDETNLFDSLDTCLKDCRTTVNQILRILNEDLGHGHAGQTRSRIAIHRKIKDKSKELIRFKNRIDSLQTAVSLNLQMIQTCLSLHFEEINKAHQENVLDSISQIRGQIGKLTIMSQQRSGGDTESVPDTAGDNTQSNSASMPTSSTSTSRKPIGTANAWIQTSNIQAWQTPSTKTRTDISGTAAKTGNFHSTQENLQRSAVKEPLAQNMEARRLSSTEEQHRRNLQAARSLLKGRNIEQAKSLCRKVINETDLNIGAVHLIHKEALGLLAHAYEYTDDGDEAARIRLLLDIRSHNSIHQEFKALLSNGNMKECIDYALGWSSLLFDNAKLQMQRQHIQGLSPAGKSQWSSSFLLAIISLTGNGILAQALLAQGVSPHGNVYCRWSTEGYITPLGCAIRLGHRNLVEIYLGAGCEKDVDLILGTNCLQHADIGRNVEIMRSLLEHIGYYLERKASMGKTRRPPTEVVQMEPYEKRKVAERVLIRSSSNLAKMKDNHPVLTVLLFNAVLRKDMDMTKLLLEYGFNDEGIIRYATTMHWLEGAKLLAREKCQISEQDIRHALANDTSIYYYLLSLRPPSTTQGTKKAMSIPENTKARGGFRSLWTSTKA